jgi:hypothetical protein
MLRQKTLLRIARTAKSRPKKKNGRKERKERKKDSAGVGAGFKPALLPLAHREICYHL